MIPADLAAIRAHFADFRIRRRAGKNPTWKDVNDCVSVLSDLLHAISQSKDTSAAAKAARIVIWETR